jgi:hypothetical protein
LRILQGAELSKALRAAVDSAEKRLWIASPYVGGWPGNVRRILGTKWQQIVPDVRLLTDVDERCFRVNTLQQFFRRGEVRSLRGLHAKLYIADDFALATSANLTGTAFSRRFECGVVLPQASAAAEVFGAWWNDRRAKIIREELLPKPKRGGTNPDTEGPPLPEVLCQLPPDAADEVLPPDVCGDYTAFLEAFGELGREYRKARPMWRQTPLSFEIDGFLNYLYRDAPGRPSRPYLKKKPRSLTQAQRRRELIRYAAQFKAAYRNEELYDEAATWRDEHARQVRRLLNRNRRHGLTRAEVKDLLLKLNVMNSYQVNLAKVLNPQNNSLGQIRKTLAHLIDETIPIQRRMSDCTGQVLGLGSAAIQELVGFYSRGKYPLRNANTNSGLRFFGYDVRAR